MGLSCGILNMPYACDWVLLTWLFFCTRTGADPNRLQLLMGVCCHVAHLNLLLFLVLQTWSFQSHPSFQVWIACVIAVPVDGEMFPGQPRKAEGFAVKTATDSSKKGKGAWMVSKKEGVQGKAICLHMYREKEIPVWPWTGSSTSFGWVTDLKEGMFPFSG